LKRSRATILETYQLDQSRASVVLATTFPVSVTGTSGGLPIYLALMGHTYAVAGEKHKAEETLHELKKLSKRRYVSAIEVALVYAGLRDTRAAFAWLQKAYDERARLPLFLKMDPAFGRCRTR
jgi:hypothetical protein